MPLGYFTLAPSTADSASLSEKLQAHTKLFLPRVGGREPSGLAVLAWAQIQEPKAKGIGRWKGKLEVHVLLSVLLFILSKYPSE